MCKCLCKRIPLEFQQKKSVYTALMLFKFYILFFSMYLKTKKNTPPPPML